MQLAEIRMNFFEVALLLSIAHGYTLSCVSDIEMNASLNFLDKMELSL